MKRVYLGLLLLILFYNVSACAGKEADTETRQMAEDKSISSDQNTIMVIEAYRGLFLPCFSSVIRI